MYKKIILMMLSCLSLQLIGSNNSQEETELQKQDRFVNSLKINSERCKLLIGNLSSGDDSLKKTRRTYLDNVDRNIKDLEILNQRNLAWDLEDRLVVSNMLRLLRDILN